VLVLFDVEALYPNVPITEALKLEKPLAAIYTKVAKL
jgi:hypothetical protein